MGRGIENRNKKADVAEHSEVSCHVGLLMNKPAGAASLLFTESSGERFLEPIHFVTSPTSARVA